MVYRHCDTLMDPDSFERSIAGETEIYCGRDISEKMHLAIGLRNHPATLTSHSHPLQLILLYKQRMMGKRRAMERGVHPGPSYRIHSLWNYCTAQIWSITPFALTILLQAKILHDSVYEPGRARAIRISVVRTVNVESEFLWKTEAHWREW